MEALKYDLMEYFETYDFKVHWWENTFHEPLKNFSKNNIIYQNIISQLNLLKHMNYIYDKINFRYIIQNAFSGVGTLETLTW